MVNGLFGERGMRSLEYGIEALSLRHRVIANNLANISTPGFKKSDISFIDELRSQLDAEDSGIRGTVFTPRVFTVRGTAERLDGNNVNPEQEMAKLAENTLLYNAVARQLTYRIYALRLAITEGRR